MSTKEDVLDAESCARDVAKAEIASRSIGGHAPYEEIERVLTLARLRALEQSYAELAARTSNVHANVEHGVIGALVDYWRLVVKQIRRRE